MTAGLAVTATGPGIAAAAGSASASGSSSSAAAGTSSAGGGGPRSRAGVGWRPPLERKASLSPAGMHKKLSVYAAAITATTVKNRLKRGQANAQGAGPAWKGPLALGTPSREEIVDQAKTLCGNYIRARLRACVGQETTGFHRLRSLSEGRSSSIDGSPPPSPFEKSPGGLSGSSSSRKTTTPGAEDAVGMEVRHLGMELERTHPKLFVSVASNVGMQALASQAAVQNLFQGIGRELLRTEVNWGRVVALYAISGALAMDCVRLGKPEFAVGLVEAMGTFFVEKNLASWIAGQGGWVSLLTHFHRKKRPPVRRDLVISVLSCLLLLFVLIYMTR